MFRCKSCGAINRVPEAKRTAADAVCGKCKAALDTSGTPQEVTGEALSRTIASSPLPVLVDFWAPWCGPCRVAGPILEELGRAQAGKLLVLKLNTEAEPAPASAFGIRGIPTFILFANGREVDRHSGVIPRAQLEQWVFSRPLGAPAAPGA